MGEHWYAVKYKNNWLDHCRRCTPCKAVIAAVDQLPGTVVRDVDSNCLLLNFDNVPARKRDMLNFVENSLNQAISTRHKRHQRALCEPEGPHQDL